MNKQVVVIGWASAQCFFHFDVVFGKNWQKLKAGAHITEMVAPTGNCSSINEKITYI